MTASGIAAEVVSAGHPGAKSRQVYRDLLNNQQAEYSSNSLLMDDEADYLVVVAGVNDTAGHIGAEFYAHHMKLIIQAALDRGITPVVLEVPEYGIEEMAVGGLLSRAKRMIYLWLFDHGKVDVIAGYREMLLRSIPAATNDKVTFVQFASIAPTRRSFSPFLAEVVYAFAR